METQATARLGTAANWFSLFTSASTLVCCALPALLVALGAGATLISLTSAFPQLIWLSENKTGVFAGAGLMLAVAGLFQWRTARLPCPVDPASALICMRQRRISKLLYFASWAIFFIGGFFAFVAPSLL